MDIEVRIRGLMMDPYTNMPIVVLKDVGSDTVMPIWVGSSRPTQSPSKSKKCRLPGR